MAKSNMWIEAINPVNIGRFWNSLIDHFGIKLVALIISFYIGIRGALKKFLDLNETGYYRESGYPSSVNQSNQAISKIPGSIMGIVGILSDMFPIFGYEKTSYMVIYTVAGIISLILLVVVPFSAEFHAPTIPALLFFFVNTQIQFCNLLVTGKYLDLMKRHPENRGSIVALEYMCLTFGGIIPGIFVGAISDYLTPRYNFIIALPFSIQSLFFYLTGCVVEDKAAPERNNRIDVKKAKAQIFLIIMNMVMFCAAMGSLFFGLFGDTNGTFMYSIGVSVVIQIGSFLTLPIYLAKLNMYLFLGQAMYLQIQPTLEYFYLGDEICVPGGPHFSYTYLKTYIAIMSQVSQMAGVWLYQAILSRFRYRQIFWISTCFRIFGSFFDLMIVNRWNIAIGIPDRYFYLFGHAVLYELTYMLDYLPFAVIIAKLCPKNIESTLYALLGGYTLYGTTIAVFAGSFVVGQLGIATGLEGGKCNFDNIGWSVAISNLILPAFLIPLAFWLIPNRKVGENIADESYEDGKYVLNYVSQHHKKHYHKTYSETIA